MCSHRFLNYSQGSSAAHISHPSWDGSLLRMEELKCCVPDEAVEWQSPAVRPSLSAPRPGSALQPFMLLPNIVVWVLFLLFCVGWFHPSSLSWMHVCACAHLYIHTPVHAHTRVCMYTHLHIHIHVHTCSHTHLYTHIGKFSPRFSDACLQLFFLRCPG